MNTMNKLSSRLAYIVVLSLTITWFVHGCSSKSDRPSGGRDTAATGQAADSVLIQEMFTEAAERWHAGDLGVLYDLEFEYLREKYTFDEYLDFKQIKYLEADTLMALVVKRINFFDHDSAAADAEAIFVGPSGDTSRFVDTYRLYYHLGRWIHPTVSVIDQQKTYDSLRHVADSAAAAEAELE